MIPAGEDKSFRGWSADSGATAPDSNYDPGSHQYAASTVPTRVVLYAVWRTVPAPTDLKVAYHRNSDTLTVSGKANDLDDRYGVVTVCADNPSSPAVCRPSSDIRVSSITANLNDPGQLAFAARADQLDATGSGDQGYGTWAETLVCPAGTPFQASNSGYGLQIPSKCSLIEMLTNGSGGGVNGTNNFIIGGRYGGSATYVTADSDFKNGPGQYDVWVFTRSVHFKVIGTPQRILAGYLYTVPSPRSSTEASGVVEVQSSSAVPRTQGIRIGGSSEQSWSVTYPAADFAGWYPMDSDYRISARLTLDSGGFTTLATSQSDVASGILPWLEVKFDANTSHGGSGTAPGSVYGYTDDDQSEMTLPGKDSMVNASGRLLGWSRDPNANESSGTIYAVGKQTMPTTGGTTSSSGYGTIVTLYGIWTVPPTPYDLAIAYHRSTDTVDVTGKVDTGNDKNDVIAVCATDGSHDPVDCNGGSGVRVEGMKIDHDDRGKINITGTADRLKKDGSPASTWIQALVCPAGAEFPSFVGGGTTSAPSNPLCSNIEMLTDDHPNGISNTDGFGINGHWDPATGTAHSDWTTSDGDFKNGPGLYDIWIYQRDQHFNIIGNKIKLISKYGYGVSGNGTSGVENLYVQLSGTGVQNWKISYPRETFVAKYPIGSEHHLVIRLSMSGDLSNPVPLEGTLPWAKTTFDANAGRGGSGTPPSTLPIVPPDVFNVLVDYDQKNALVKLPDPTESMKPGDAEFVGWNKVATATAAGNDDVSPANSMGDAANRTVYLNQEGADTETDVDLFAIWHKRTTPTITGMTRDESTGAVVITGTGVPWADQDFAALRIVGNDGQTIGTLPDSGNAPFTFGGGNSADGSDSYTWSYTIGVNLLPEGGSYTVYAKLGGSEDKDWRDAGAARAVYSPETSATYSIRAGDNHNIPQTGGSWRAAAILAALLAFSFASLVVISVIRECHRSQHVW